MFLVTFFFTKPMRARGKRTKNPKEKNALTHVFQTWPTNDTPSSMCWAQSFFKNLFLLLLFPNDDIQVVKQLLVATVRKGTFPGTRPSFPGKECSRLFSTDRHCERIRLPEIVRYLKWEALMCLDSQSNTHPGFVKARPHHSQHSPCSAISTGGIVAFGSPLPDSLAEDCRLIITRRCWKFGQIFDECAWIESIIFFWITNGVRHWSYRLLPSDYAKEESFSPSFSQTPWRKCDVHSTASLKVNMQVFRSPVAESTTLVWFWHWFFFFFFSNFSQKLHGRVTRNIEKKKHMA